MDIIIYHNPVCGTSRNELALIRNAGIEPHVFDYLKTPPSREMLEQLIQRAGITPRELLREKELAPDEKGIADSDILDAMIKRPILINRPLVVSPLGVKLCRPSETVLDLLPDTHSAPFAKEDGEQVIGAGGERLK